MLESNIYVDKNGIQIFIQVLCRVLFPTHSISYTIDYGTQTKFIFLCRIGALTLLCVIYDLIGFESIVARILVSKSV